jgi:aminobenzoyl-glutamate utilization protein B
MPTAVPVVLIASLLPAAPPTDTPQTTSDAWVDARAAEIDGWADDVWRFAEPAFQEHRSAKRLADALESGGFAVKRGVADMKTAFVAEWGSGRPVIALLAEYDALPGLSQKAGVAEKSALEPGRPGHGCGHNLLGAASVAAGLAVRDAMVRHKLPGTIRVYGTPAEEGGSGKVYMVRAGLFADVDACLTWHPAAANHVTTGSCLAIRRARFRFRGATAHSAGNPQDGRSALDAVELMNVGVNYLREHIPSDARVHYVITRGGGRPNVVPDFAESWYYVRSPTMAGAAKVYDRVLECARGAAIMTRTTMEVEQEDGSWEVLPNLVLSAVMHRQLQRVGPPAWDADDYRLARALRKAVGAGSDNDPDGKVLDGKTTDIHTGFTNGSTDVGDVSWTCPTAELKVACKPLNAGGHSWDFVASAGSNIGRKGCRTAAKVMAGSVVELLLSPEQVKAAAAEFRDRTKGSSYKPYIPDGKPPEKIDP